MNVIVGSGLAAVRAVEALREAGSRRRTSDGRRICSRTGRASTSPASSTNRYRSRFRKPPDCNEPGPAASARVKSHAVAPFGRGEVTTMSLLQSFKSSATTMQLGIAGALLALASACSPAPAPVSQSPRDPSNPSAPEGVAPLVVAQAAAAPASASASAQSAVDRSGHDHHAEGATEGVVYACPMHLEVTSEAPGVCPKCNMKLVPKK
jgi:hypothetical protein